MLQNLSLYQLWVLIFAETQDVRECTNFFSLENIHSMFLIWPSFFAVFVRLFLIKYPEYLIKEGTNMLEFCYVCFSLLLSFWLSSLWFFSDKEFPANMFVVVFCHGHKVKEFTKPIASKGRLMSIAFLTFFTVTYFITYIRAVRLSRTVFRGSINRVGLRFKRNMVDYRESLFFFIYLITSRIGREVVLLLLYIYRVQLEQYMMEIFVIFYFIKELWYTVFLVLLYISCTQKCQELFTQQNKDSDFGIISLLSIVPYCFPNQRNTMYIK
ncbi:uncharacterized protein LOC111712636 [Eurytemora carolleeae]|uniref:uncharacterized protein LOC111712636 n=1 Tax=Eurytemora carolleeae TaxID=1294199 RepID=UPI000C78A7D4|nr:uncharacterized protein LOC111712636 [Eurytemora carolleeae]|eukprot:XP_023343082.1 uncharacterized protein LOC111712636 [Eurytemora affinis]